ncbi:MAG TPA: C4-dicarboxylate ABC transporter substrate-binding protein [Alphaproteobacteria bacterium]|mgnify:CR=1 FL=1|nr:C4-dicarboxylate ABC transporter substrate-binding protein [Alphaproteobacteria bacterium]
MNKQIIILFLFVLGSFAYFTPTTSIAADKYITIGTGGVTGVYYPAGGAICRLVNRGRKEHGIRCSVESTGGSVYNLNALRAGELEVAVAQSDWQYHSYMGTGPFKELGADKKLRSLFSLHSEPFTVVVRADSGITTLDDIKGKRVNIGNQGSGQRATMEAIMEVKGWSMNDFKSANELRASEQAQALCDGKIDVMIYAAGHPNGAVQEVTTTCNAKILEVSDKDIDRLINQFPFYSYTVIPGGMYSGNEKDIKTFGVKATFVSTEDVDEEVIYQVVKAVFENFENFKTLHPVFSILEPKNLVKDGNTAPLHNGSIKYFREKGWM